ncbi:hypothetical protein [Castellaniella sp.]|uniref:hypothetical protein n=1 Tax=Castellaniella sp. TaxID=1955812 RepID=UPI002B001996|nr:hypothetical protein [Castellaniella sp.]
MPILISKTYEILDEESLEAGETNDRGFEFEDKEFDFKELVRELENYPNPSCYPGVPHWVSSNDDPDLATGDTVIYSLHPGRDARSQRYWAKACRAAGICD